MTAPSPRPPVVVLRLLLYRSVRIAPLLLTLVACKDSGPPAPLPPSAALDPGWTGSAHVPQLADIGPTYDRIGAQTVAALSASLLVCHIDVELKPRDNSAPDLVAWLTIGKRHAVWVRAPYSNSWSATVSWPAVDLVLGEQLAISIYDEDSWTNDDFIAKLETRFDGTLPILLSDSAATIECRALEPTVLHARLRDALASADRALDALDAVAPPDLIANHLERPHDAVDSVRGAIGQAAALVGWHVPAVRTRVAREQASEHAWKAKLAAGMEHLARTLPAGRATLTCDAVAIDRALPANDRPYRPASACMVTIANAASTDLVLYAPDGQVIHPSWYDGTQFVFPVRAVDAPAIKLARLEADVLRVR